MAREVALLRGINVGTAKRGGMADLRALVEGLGYGDVRTLLNSGNVVFSVPRTAKGDAGARIEKALVAKLGVESRVIVLSPSELAAMVEENPLLDIAKDHSRMMVGVIAAKYARAKVLPMLDEKWAPEALA